MLIAANPLFLAPVLPRTFLLLPNCLSRLPSLRNSHPSKTRLPTTPALSMAPSEISPAPLHSCKFALSVQVPASDEHRTTSGCDPDLHPAPPFLSNTFLRSLPSSPAILAPRARIVDACDTLLASLCGSVSAMRNDSPSILCSSSPLISQYHNSRPRSKLRGITS